MARTIDERIVQMTFNNQEFERRANTTISTLGKLTQALNPLKMTQAFTGMQRAANGLNLTGVSSALDGVGRGFNALEEIAVGALRRIGDEITGKLLGTINKVKSTIDSLTTQQIGAGYQKYNDLTSSVQTLVNSTGKSVEEIDGYLERLMWYSDETSFGFTDMTKALGTMVSSGGDINKLIPMLMGVGNATAFAGKTAAEFQRVIYNLNQSYSSGYLNTIDWKSISGASVDSKELKEQLLGAAVELGKITKSQAKLENFSKLMSDKVFDRNVMELAFGRFAEFTLKVEEAVKNGEFETASEAMKALSGSTAKFAEDAFVAGQSAKSFKEAIEATQDAVSSGWMKTFQLVFGDYNESKALWTDVTETFWDIFASGAARRNKILDAWTEIWEKQVKNPSINSAADYAEWQKITPFLTQTQALVSAISDTILGIRDMVKDTYRSVFPIHTILDEDGNAVEDYAYTAKKIFGIVENIRKAFINISENGLDSDFAVAFRNDFRAILEIVKTIAAYVKTFNESFIKPLKKQLKPVLDEIVSLFNNLGKIIFKTARRAREDMSPFEAFLSNLLKILNPVITLIAKLLHWINELLEGASAITLFDGVFKTIGGVVEWISNIISGTLPKLSQFGEVISGVFGKVKEVIGDFLSSNGANMSKLAEGGFLAYLGFGLSTLIKKFKDLDIAALGKNFLGGVGDGVKEMFSSIKEGIDSLFGRGQPDFSSKLEALSNALIKMAAAVLVLSLVDADKVGTSLKMMAAGLTEMIVAMGLLGNMKFSGNMRNPAKAIQKVATAILELAIALKIMSGIDPLGMTTAIMGLGFALVELSLFMVVLSNASKNLQAANTKALAQMITKLGFAMIEIALAMKIIASLDGNGLSRSLIGMGVALGEIAAFVIAVSKFTGTGAAAKIAMLGPAIMGIGLALIEIAAALKLLSTIDQAGMDRALVALFASLGTIALLVVALSKLSGGLNTIAVATGILIMASAIGMLTLSLIALSAIGWEKMKEGLKIMAALLVVVGGGAAVLGLFSPLILAFALSLTALGGSLLVLSEGILKAVAAFTLLQMLGPDVFGKIVDVMTDAFAMIIALIPSFILGIVEAVIQTAGKLIELVGTIIRIVITAINDNLPMILEGIITFVSNVLDALGNAITIWGPKIFDIAFELLNMLITGLRNNLPTLLENLYGLLIDAINGLANIIRTGGGALGEALGNLAGAIIEGLFGAIGGLLGGTVEGIIGAGQGLFNGAKEIWNNLFGSKDQEEAQQKSGVNIVKNVTEGMEANKKEAIDKAEEIGEDVTDEFDRPDEAKDSGISTLDGLLVGLRDEGRLAEIFAAGAQAGTMFMQGYNSTMSINSPSREMEKSAKFTVQGLIEGFKDLDNVSDASKKVGEAVYNSIQSALALASELMDDALNPVITPVIDLSQVEANSDAIQGIFGNNLAMNGALSIDALRMMQENQNGLYSKPVNNITLNNTFNFDKASDLDDTQLKGIARKLANEINVLLGKAV